MSIKSSFKWTVIPLMFLSASIAVFGGDPENIPELKDYKTVSLSEPVPVFSENFEGPVNRWMLPKGFEIRKNLGRSYTKAVFRHSESKKDYNVARCLVKGLEPGKKYDLLLWTRKVKGQSGSACVEFYQGKKYLGGSYNPEIFGPAVPDGWAKRRYRFTAPAKGVNTYIGLFIIQEKNQTRIKEAVWDDLTIVPATEKEAVLYPIGFQNLQTDEHGTVSVGEVLFGTLNQCREQLRLLLEVAGKRKLLAADKNGIYSAQFGKLPAGQLKVKAWLLNVKQKTIEAKFDFHCYKNELKPVRGSVWIDKHGRTVTDGKPMLPVGIYTMDLTEKDLKIISDCGFDFIIPYTLTLNYRPFGSQNKNTYKRIQAALDTCVKYNLRVALPLLNEQAGFEGNPDAEAIYRKMIATVKNHRGLFCYFTADEVTLEKLARKQRRRELIASLDPFHPVFVNDYVPDRFAQQRRICDVFGYDIYPVTESKNTSLASSSIELNRWKNLPPFPLWFVPQAWQSWLTHRQMLAHALSGAVFGAKGFALYSYNTNTNKDPEVRKKLLPGMKQTARQLRELEPWIISTANAPEMSLTPPSRPGQTNSVNARAFRDENGRDAIVIVSDGPGTAQAAIQFSGSAGLVSKYGNTVNAGNGKYLYKADGINCDVLLPEDVLRKNTRQTVRQ